MVIAAIPPLWFQAIWKGSSYRYFLIYCSTSFSAYGVYREGHSSHLISLTLSLFSLLQSKSGIKCSGNVWRERRAKIFEQLWIFCCFRCWYSVSVRFLQESVDKDMAGRTCLKDVHMEYSTLLQTRAVPAICSRAALPLVSGEQYIFW